MDFQLPIDAWVENIVNYILDNFQPLLDGIAPSGFDQTDRAFTTAIRSFRPLTAAEAEAIRPSRIDFYTVRTGDTWASIAERSGGAIRASTLAVMNHEDPSAQPRVGARIRIVVAG